MALNALAPLFEVCAEREQRANYYILVYMGE